MTTAAKGVLFFAISALLGWVLESIASSCLALRPVNSGFLRGAYIPAYGVCVFAALTAKALIPIGLGLPLQIGFVFAVSALTKAGYRLVAASLARSIYQVSLWDDDLLYYSDQDGDRAGHFTGRAARLLWLISGGLYGILMAVILHPYIAGFISRLGALPAGLLSSAFVVYLVLDLRQSLKEASILSKTGEMSCICLILRFSAEISIAVIANKSFNPSLAAANLELYLKIFSLIFVAALRYMPSSILLHFNG